MKSIKISVIVPVYNLQDYVSETIDSIISQTFDAWELILVNDGSADSSLDIMRAYALKDCRIHVIDQPNGGVSAARRNGLHHAQGEYVTFLDGDDLFTNDALEYAYSTLQEKGVDMLSCSIQRGLRPGSRVQRLQDRLYNKEQYAEAHASYRIKMGKHGEFYRRTVLLKHDVVIDRKIVNNEDYLYKLFLLQDLNSVYTSSKVIHLYRYRDGSACHKEYPVEYWYMYFTYLEDNYARFGIEKELYMKSKLTKVTSLLRLFSYTWDFNHPSVKDIKRIPIKYADSFYKKLALLYAHTNSSIIKIILQFHPTLLFKQ